MLDVGFRPDVNVPWTISNPGEISAVELGCRTDIDITSVQIVPRTSLNSGEISAVELRCRTDKDITTVQIVPRTSSNPGAISTR